jgi:hypothetical protein
MNLTQTDSKLAMKAFSAARTAIQNCYAQVNAYADAEENHPDGFEVDEYLNDMAEHLAALSKNAVDSLRILLELLGLKGTLINFENRVAQFEEADFQKVGYFDEYFGANNVVVDEVRRRLDRIAPLLKIPADMETERRVLARMLRQTAHYLDEIGNVPTREKDIQDALLPTLRLAFPDVIRETPIAKQTKTYHPDFGIESIAAAVEVKFVENKSKAKLALGQLYEDMKGYAASEFTHFVGLVYMTGAYLSQDQVDAEMKKVGTPKNWHIQLVFGSGTTKSKHSQAKSVANKS